jgi:hypothetical protein
MGGDHEWRLFSVGELIALQLTKMMKNAGESSSSRDSYTCRTKHA